MTIAQHVIELLRGTGALLEGHFLLTSGLHSSRYIQCALALQYPEHAASLGKWLAQPFRDMSISAVISPALGGVIVGHETARALGVRAIFGEREDGQMRLRRGLSIAPQERVLVVEDVTTTGGSVREIITLVKDAYGVVAGVGAIVDRSGSSIDFGVPFQALATLQVPTYPPDACPLCQQGTPAIKPGSRRTV